MRRDRVKLMAVAHLRIERARAQMAKDAAGATMDEVETGRVSAGRALVATNIPRGELSRLDDDALALLVDAWLDHEASKPPIKTGKR
jgi:hypothetical protein